MCFGGRGCGLFLFLLVATVPASAEGRFSLESAEPLVFREEGKVLEAAGPARIHYLGWTVTAERVIVRVEEGTAVGEGMVEVRKEPGIQMDPSDWEVEGALGELVRALEDSPVLIRAEKFFLRQGEQISFLRGPTDMTTPDFRWRVEELEFIPETDAFRFSGVRLGGENFRIGAAEGTLADERMHLREATVFPGEPDPFALNLVVSELIIGRDNQAEARGVWLKIGPVPYFYWPRLQFELSRSDNRFRGEAGYNRTLGVFAKMMPRIAITETVQLRPFLDLYSERGVLIAPGVTFDQSRNPGPAQGLLQVEGGWIRDQKDPRFDIRGDPIDPQRGWLNVAGWGTHESGWQASGNLAWWSDSEVLRDFRPSWNIEQQDPLSFVEVRQAGSWIEAEAFAHFRPNRFQEPTEVLPAVELRLLPTAIGELPVRATGYGRIENLRRTGFANEFREEAWRFDTYTGADWSVETVSPLGLNLVGGVRNTHWRFDEPDAVDSTRILGEVGFDMALPLMADWPVESRTWRIDGLRHRLEPVLGYRWVGVMDDGGELPGDFHPATRVAGIPPLSLRARRDVESLGNQQVLRVGAWNLLQTWRGDSQAVELVRLGVFQDLRWDIPGDESRDLSTHVVGEWTPVHWFALRGYGNWDTTDSTYRLAHGSVSVRDSNLWSLSVGYEGVRGTLSEWVGEGEYALTERTRLLGFLRWDGRNDRLTEQRVGYRFRLGSSWDATVYLSWRRDDQRLDDFQISMSASSLQF